MLFTRCMENELISYSLSHPTNVSKHLFNFCIFINQQTQSYVLEQKRKAEGTSNYR